MSDRSTTYYLNSDFDLGLRPRPLQLGRPGLVRQVRELSVQAVLGVDAGDAALVRAAVPPEFLAHLAECGLAVPRLLPHPRIDPATRLLPFGWSAEAIELNRAHHRRVDHPPLEIVRRLNARSLALEIEADLLPGGPTGALVESRQELEAFLRSATARGGWVVKSEHGHAGLSNRRLAGSRLTEVDRRFVEERLAEDDRLVVEPWLERERDWCAVFEVPFAPEALRIHETVCTRDGALIGAWFDPDSHGPPHWPEDLARAIERVAARLADEGYFGAACIDAFSWRDGPCTRLRPLVDLNCRRSMSDGAYRLWRCLAPERTLYYRFFNRRKFAFPAELAPALAALGPQRYDRGRRRGILLVSPLRVGSGSEAWRPGKLAVCFVGDGRTDVLRLERWFRERFEV